MHKVYVLSSLLAQKSYVGVTGDVERRLKEHNSGKNIYTSRYKPWIIVHLESFSDKEEALNREKFLKSTTGRRFLKKIFTEQKKGIYSGVV